MNEKTTQTTETEIVADPNFIPDEGGYLEERFGDIVLRRADQLHGSGFGNYNLGVTRTWTHPHPGKPFDQKIYGAPRKAK